MELRYRREAIVGVMIVVAAAVFLYMMLWLRGKSLRGGEIVRATFTDVAGLNEGDPVRSSGVKVGQVQLVKLTGPGVVTVTFDVKLGPSPRRDAGAVIKSLDFFGARYIEYQPGHAAEPLSPDSAIRGVRAADFGEMAEGLSGQGRELLANATDLISPSAAGELRAVLAQARRTLEQLGNVGNAPSAQLASALGDLRRVSQRLDLLLANNTAPATATMQSVQQAAANMAQITQTLTHTTVTLDSLLAKVNTGRGTFGQLANDTTLLAELRRTNRHLDSLVTDFMANPKKYINVSVF
jgi:phospholipid/cholesterol/gamma-HCH transport system substrate-binding protein